MNDHYNYDSYDQYNNYDPYDSYDYDYDPYNYTREDGNGDQPFRGAMPMLKTYDGYNAQYGGWGNYNNYVFDSYGEYIYSTDPVPHFKLADQKGDGNWTEIPLFSFNQSNIAYYIGQNGSEVWYYKRVDNSKWCHIYSPWWYGECDAWNNHWHSKYYALYDPDSWNYKPNDFKKYDGKDFVDMDTWGNYNNFVYDPAGNFSWLEEQKYYNWTGMDGNYSFNHSNIELYTNQDEKVDFIYKQVDNSYWCKHYGPDWIDYCDPYDVHSLPTQMEMTAAPAQSVRMSTPNKRTSTSAHSPLDVLLINTPVKRASIKGASSSLDLHFSQMQMPAAPAKSVRMKNMPNRKASTSASSPFDLLGMGTPVKHASTSRASSPPDLQVSLAMSLTNQNYDPYSSYNYGYDTQGNYSDQFKTYNGMDIYNGTWGNYNNYYFDPYGDYAYNPYQQVYYSESNDVKANYSFNMSNVGMGYYRGYQMYYYIQVDNSYWCDHFGPNWHRYCDAFNWYHDGTYSYDQYEYDPYKEYNYEYETGTYGRSGYQYPQIYPGLQAYYANVDASGQYSWGNYDNYHHDPNNGSYYWSTDPYPRYVEEPNGNGYLSYN